jgi:O-antigen/teichoic acid export membrane protein
MRLRNTILTGAASYIQMGSLMVTQLVAIPLALHFLDYERFGLWSFVSQSLGYLLLLDFGVSSSLGRLLAEPIHRGDEREWSGWFNLSLVVLTIQAALIFGVGLVFVDPILRWFNIPAALLTEARQLWLMMLFLNALTFPLRLFQAILGAQNRVYWAYVGATVSVWIGLVVFYLCLKQNCGSLAYGYSAIAQTLVSLGLPLVAVLRGPNWFRVSLRGIPWHHARELFGFSSAVFVICIAVQVAFMSQSLVITKILGLGAVASFTVCSRVPMLLMQLVWRPFDAFIPRWQIYWAKGQTEPLTKEFRRMVQLTIGLSALAMVCCFAMNRWFVFIFGKQDLYAGKLFDFFFALFVIVQVWNHCLSFNFVLAKRMKGLAAVAAADTVIGIGLAIMGTKMFGLTGYIAFTALYGLMGIAVWYITLKAPAILGLSPGKLFKDSSMSLLVFSALLAAGLLIFRQTITPKHLIAAEGSIAITALVWFVSLFWKDLLGMFRRLQRARQNQLVSNDAPPTA